MVPSRLPAQAQATVVSQVMATDCDTGTLRRLHDGYLCPAGQQWTERSHRHRLHQASDHTAAVEDRAHVEHADFTPGKAAFQFALRFSRRGAGRLRHDRHAVIIRADDGARAGREPDDRLIDHPERLLDGALRGAPIAEHLEAELADRRTGTAGSLLPKQQAAVFAKIFMFSNLFGVSGDENGPQARLPQ